MLKGMGVPGFIIINELNFVRFYGCICDCSYDKLWQKGCMLFIYWKMKFLLFMLLVLPEFQEKIKYKAREGAVKSMS